MCGFSFLIQGPLMLSVGATRDRQLNPPWGARSLIAPTSGDAAAAVVLYVRFVEYDYRIEFPPNLLTCEM